MVDRPARQPASDQPRPKSISQAPNGLISCRWRGEQSFTRANFEEIERACRRGSAALPSVRSIDPPQLIFELVTAFGGSSPRRRLARFASATACSRSSSGCKRKEDLAQAQRGPPLIQRAAVA